MAVVGAGSHMVFSEKNRGSFSGADERPPSTLPHIALVHEDEHAPSVLAILDDDKAVQCAL
jgi:hypothetical protein